MDLADVANFDPDRMPWTEDSTFNAWRDAILKKILLDGHRDNALKLLAALDPAADREPKDVIKAQFWNNALSAPPHGEERKKQLAAFLADLACLREAAPHVARGLIGNDRIKSTALQVAAFAERVRKGKSDPVACLGVMGFTDADWAKLDILVANASAAADEKTK
jgi:hypothetical protein